METIRDWFKKWGWLIIPILVVLTGAALLIVEIVLENAHANLPMADATIVKLNAVYDMGCTPFVQFVVDGQAIIAELDCYVSTMKVGDVVPIHYDPSNTSRVYYAGRDTKTLLLVIGIVVLLLGLVVLALSIFLHAQKKKQKADQANIPHAPLLSKVTLHLEKKAKGLPSLTLWNAKCELIGKLEFGQETNQRDFTITLPRSNASFTHDYHPMVIVNGEPIYHIDGKGSSALFEAMGMHLLLGNVSWLEKGGEAIAIFHPFAYHESQEVVQGENLSGFDAALEVEENELHAILLAALCLVLSKPELLPQNAA